jgi:hypothetical protein
MVEGVEVRGRLIARYLRKESYWSKEHQIEYN